MLEVVVALAILAISLSVLLEAQVSSLAAAGRTRGLTFGSLLARAKMVDVERDLFDEGFTSGDVEEEGDFTDDGHPEIKWKSRVLEVELDLSALSSLGGSDTDGGSDKDKKDGADSLGVGSLLGGAGGIDGFISEMGKAIRVIEVTVTWPDGKYTESMTVRSLVTREDLAGGQGMSTGMPGFPGGSVGTGQSGSGKGTTVPSQALP